MEQLGRVFVLATIGLLVGGCSIRKIPDPFMEQSGFGEVVEEIVVEGNRYTQTWIILATMGSREGDLYTEETARRDYLWLSRLGTFTSVRFRTEPLGDGVRLTTTVEEISPWIPGLSLGISQENGLELGPSVSSPNLFGWAARASAFARFGGATNFGVRYRDPPVPGKSWLFGYDIEYNHRERDNSLDVFREKSDEINFQLRRNLTNDIHPGIRLSYLSLASDVDGITLSPDNRDNIPGIGLFIQADTRNAAYPTNGWWGEVEAYRYGLFGGDGDFWRFTGDLRRYVQLPFGRRHSLAAYSMLTMTTGEVGTDIPIHQDFHIGGTNSVRGWPLDSRVGKNQWLNTLEYWFRLMDERAFKIWFVRWRMGLQLGAFGDVGTAWTASDEFGQNFIGGYGGGLRLTIPVVVLLRLDLAYSQRGLGLQFSVGGGEKAEAQRKRIR